MILYSKNNTEFDTSEFEYFNHGNSSNIFRKDDLALKLYFNECRDFFRIKKATFKLLKELNDSGIVRLYDYFYRSTNSLYKLGSIDAYTMEYIESKPFEFRELEKQLFIELIEKLDETIMNLSNHGIALDDLNKGNFVLSPQGFKIVDPDMFHKSNIRQKDCFLYHSNKTYLLNRISYIIKKELDEKDNTTKENSYPTVIIFNSDTESTLTEIVKRTLTEDTLENEYFKKLKRFH